MQYCLYRALDFDSNFILTDIENDIENRSAYINELTSTGVYLYLQLFKSSFWTD